MKKLLLILLCIPFLNVSGNAQMLVYSTDQNKHCTINLTRTDVKNNQFDVNLKVNWVDENVKKLTDFNSVVGFDVENITYNVPYLKLLSKEMDQKVIAFNAEQKLTYEISEEFQGGDIAIIFPFFYASNFISAAKPELRQEFTFKQPRSYKFSFNLDRKLIVDKTNPKLSIISPKGVELGLKQIVDTNAFRVQLTARDIFGIEKVMVNNIYAVKVGDSTYIADIPLLVGYENPITVIATDKSGLTTEKQFKIESRKSNIIAVNNTSNQPINKEKQPSDVDIDIPAVASPNSNRFALIIGNEDYSTYQKTLQVESNVEFAVNDAKVFKEYAIKILGVPEENIILAINANLREMNRELNKVNGIVQNLKGQSEIFVFYAGHGFPDEQTREAYLVPVDVSGSEIQDAIKLSDFYKKLTEYPAKRVIVFLDACFSGGGRNLGLLAARGVRVKPKETALKGNLVVFSASSGEQSSLPYRDKQHGLFTYYLFKKLKETGGDISCNDLSDYLSQTVSVRSLMVNNKVQNPQTNISPLLGDKWKEWRMK